MEYSNIVIDHFEQPRNVLATCAKPKMFGRAGSKAVGASIEFCLEIGGDRLDKMRFRAWGCPHTIAVASWLTEELPGKRIADVQSLDLEFIAAELGLPPEKWSCVLMAEDALRDALPDMAPISDKGVTSD